MRCRAGEAAVAHASIATSFLPGESAAKLYGRQEYVEDLIEASAPIQRVANPTLGQTPPPPAEDALLTVYLGPIIEKTEIA